MNKIMNDIDEAKRLESLFESVQNGETEVSNELISELRDFILKDDGEINNEKVFILKDNTELKLVPRKVNTIDGPMTVFGVQYKNIGIEVGRLK